MCVITQRASDALPLYLNESLTTAKNQALMSSPYMTSLRGSPTNRGLNCILVRIFLSVTTPALVIHLKRGISSKSRMAALVAVVALLFLARVALAEVIPASRTAPWQGNVGVPGG